MNEYILYAVKPGRLTKVFTSINNEIEEQLTNISLNISDMKHTSKTKYIEKLLMRTFGKL